MTMPMTSWHDLTIITTPQCALLRHISVSHQYLLLTDDIDLRPCHWLDIDIIHYLLAGMGGRVYGGPLRENPEVARED